MAIHRQSLWRFAILAATIVAVSALHYHTPTDHVWLHPLFQRAYYVPILLMALLFGWRGGLAGAAISAVLYLPHIMMSWGAHPEYRAAQYIEVVTFFVVSSLVGVLADHERMQRHKVEETARRLAQANTELQASFEQLRRADRLSALGELSAGLAHEIRNPLGGVEGAVQILRRPVLPDESRQEFGDLAQKEIDRLKGLLSNFLEFARPQEPRRTPTDPGLLLESVARLVSETAKMSGVRVVCRPAASVPELYVDAEQVKQVLLNLVLNAIQASSAGEEIELRTCREEGNVVFEIADQGAGIAAENIERIFNPFFTTRSGGTGLGLSIAYRIMTQHDGQITVRQNLERGTTFRVALPLTQTPILETTR
jgi:signal transduction histidine kinase